MTDASSSALDRRVLGLFETPVIVSKLAGAAAINAALIPLIHARRQGHQGIARSNILGWHSDTKMIEWGGEAAADLLRHLIRLCDLQVHDSGAVADAPPRFIWSFDMWANLSMRGASNQGHAHPGALWSAVYYVDDGYQGSKDPALGGELVLYDPRYPMNAMYVPDILVKDSRDGVQAREQYIRPATGRMVVFPSWLMHSVRPYHGDAERISVAINLSLVPAQTVDQAFAQSSNERSS
ncbi:MULTISPECIES: 2OG-Fe(II) oxygenase family protein [unclassified Iodidimonas]|uniref:2OG-Fe(II) oxygenase family protein n=1 Tax=unclassified Iodidimonas TaxID=2626145 RepID=UPI002482484D|nr:MULTISPECIES: 2OG-Fe(II) oxygenase family protein [unclassified Iodidimonas]